jgi:16S rRNA C967 or C1407 C5-methylase (RsmB/RsmF family)
MAGLVGAAGKIVAVDIQPQTLARLEHRARRAGLATRVERRLAKGARSLASSTREARWTLFWRSRSFTNAGAFSREIAKGR